MYGRTFSSVLATFAVGAGAAAPPPAMAQVRAVPGHRGVDDDVAANRRDETRSVRSTVTPAVNSGAQQYDVSSLVSSALQNTTLSATTLGLTLPLVGTATKNTVASLISPIGPALDPVLITLLDSVGVRVGEADVALNGMRCDGSVLVN